MSLRVTEIFYSIQGESTHAGRPCAFVRLTGCPLRCEWCDTAYAFTGGEDFSIAQILEKLHAFACNLVEITGGEPLAQEETPALLQALLDEGYEVLLETSGAISISSVPAEVRKIVDLKAPGSGEERRNLWENLPLMVPHDEIKFVIADRRDYEWARDVVRCRGLERRVRAVHFSPVHGKLDPAVLAEWMKTDKVPARLQLQLHKLLWPAKDRGI